MPRRTDEEYLRRGAILLSLVTILGYFVNYAFDVGLTRVLSAHDYGDFKVAHSFAFFFGLAVLLGGDRMAPMVLAPGLEMGHTRLVGEFVRFYLRNALWLSLGLVLLTWLVSFLHLGTSDPTDHHPLAWAVVAVPINAAGAMISRVLQAAKLPMRSVVPWRLGLPIVQLALFGVVVWVRGELSAILAIAISMVATGTIVCWQWREVLRFQLVDFRRDRESRTARRWLATSLPLMGSFLVALALNQSDLYFLELMAEESSVGHYAAASGVAHFLTIIQVTVIGLAAPLVRPAIEGGASRSRNTFRRATSLMLVALVPTALLLVTLGKPILAIYGTEYRIGYPVLLLLLAGNLGWALAALSALWLQYRHRGPRVLAVSIGTLVIDSAANLVLIPRFGMVGAAAGTAVTLIVAGLAIVVAHARMPRVLGV